MSDSGAQAWFPEEACAIIPRALKLMIDSGRRHDGHIIEWLIEQSESFRHFALPSSSPPQHPHACDAESPIGEKVQIIFGPQASKRQRPFDCEQASFEILIAGECFILLVTESLQDASCQSIFLGQEAVIIFSGHRPHPSKPSVFRRSSCSSSQGTRSGQNAWRRVAAGCPSLPFGSMHARLTATTSGRASRLIVSGDPQFLHRLRCTVAELSKVWRSPPLVHRKPALGKIERVTNAAPWSIRHTEQWQ
jgi:hypothetical protein